MSTGKLIVALVASSWLLATVREQACDAGTPAPHPAPTRGATPADAAHPTRRALDWPAAMGEAFKQRAPPRDDLADTTREGFKQRAATSRRQPQPQPETAP